MAFRRRVGDLISFLSRKKYEEGKTDGELDATRIIRLQEYGKICQIRLVNIFWNGTKTDVMKELQVKNKDEIYYSVICFTCALLLMLVGGVAAAFPDSAPFPMYFAGLGAWQAILCLLGSYHLDMVPFFPTPQHSLNSMLTTSALFTLYWALSAQDPEVVHLMGRLFMWIVKWIWKIAGWICSLFYKAGGAIKTPVTRSPRNEKLLAPGQP